MTVFHGTWPWTFYYSLLLTLNNVIHRMLEKLSVGLWSKMWLQRCQKKPTRKSEIKRKSKLWHVFADLHLTGVGMWLVNSKHSFINIYSTRGHLHLCKHIISRVNFFWSPMYLLLFPVSKNVLSQLSCTGCTPCSKLLCKSCFSQMCIVLMQMALSLTFKTSTENNLNVFKQILQW